MAAAKRRDAVRLLLAAYQRHRGDDAVHDVFRWVKNERERERARERERGRADDARTTPLPLARSIAHLPPSPFLPPSHRPPFLHPAQRARRAARERGGGCGRRARAAGCAPVPAR
jgi:hypothetical protein